MRLLFESVQDASEYAVLVRIWERAVRATHDFLPEERLLFYKEALPRDYFPQVELTLARAEAGGPPRAFMGISPPGVGPDGFPLPAKLEMLFVDPARHGRGIGRAFVRRARAQYGTLDVDVNEQNSGATRFYERCGFVRVGRSALDGQGDPFPLLHLRKKG